MTANTHQISEQHIITHRRLQIFNTFLLYLLTNINSKVGSQQNKNILLLKGENALDIKYVIKQILKYKCITKTTIKQTMKD